jgi:L-serine dehydratase
MGGNQMAEYSVFDVVGPVMIGPSSSHTAGAARLGKVAYKIAGDDVKEVKFYLHGSFAKTYRGHGTDKALLAGVLGISESDERLKKAFKIAKERGINYEFIEFDLGDVHPNSVKIEITKKDGKCVSIAGSSIGGGNIIVSELNGVELTITGDNPTLIAKHTAAKGLISNIANVLNDYDKDILFMSFHKKSKSGDGLIVVEVSDELTKKIVDEVRDIEGILEIYLL